MDLAKKIIIYSLGLASIGLAIAVISAGYLVLMPDSELFGYHYLTGSLVNQTDEYTEGLNDYEAIEVDSNRFDISLYPVDSNSIEVDFANNASGFTQEDINKFDYTYTYDNVNKTIKLKVEEPSKGIIFYNKAYINIGIPNTVDAKDINIKSSGGQVILGEETPFGNLDPLTFNTSNLTIENTKAPMKLQNFTVTENFSISNVSGRTDILNNVDTNVEINSEIGSFTFGEGTQTYDIAGDLVIQASNAYVKAGNVGGNATYNYETGSGLIKLKEVSKDVDIRTSNTQVHIESALKNVTIISEYNTIKIDNIGIQEDSGNYNAVLNITNGSIEIGSIYYALDVVSTRGNVTVDNAYWDANITTTYGDVSINYNENAPRIKDVQDQHSYLTLNVETTEGSIEATNLKTETSLNVASGSSTASIQAEFLEINLGNTINAGRKEINVVIPPLENYDLKAITSNGGVDILAADAYKTEWTQNDVDSETGKFVYEKSIQSGSVVNTITITSTAGTINVTV
jgi:hypothetical protein